MLLIPDILTDSCEVLPHPVAVELYAEPELLHVVQAFLFPALLIEYLEFVDQVLNC